MAVGEGIWRPDADGHVECSQKQRVCAQRLLGVGGEQPESAANKAQDDYVNRSNNPGSVDPSQVTFVFVTMRHFKHKVEWRDQRADGIWKDVRVPL